MKRISVYVICGLMAGLLLAGGVGLEWLLEHPDGLRWLFGAVSRRGKITISARNIQGGITDALRLEGVTVRWDTGQLTLEEIRLRWQPLLLLSGTLAVREMTLRGVDIRDDAPPRSGGPELTWPRLSGIASRLDGAIDMLDITDLVFRSGSSPPLRLARAGGRVTLRQSRLFINDLTAESAQGRLRGGGVIGLGTPRLTATLAVEPARKPGGYTRYLLRTAFLEGAGDGILQGDFSLTAGEGVSGRLLLSGSAAVGARELRVLSAALSQEGRSGTVSGSGIFRYAGSGDVRLELGDIDLARELHEKLTVSGTITLAGTPAAYTGRIDLSSRSDGWRNVRLMSALQGGRDQFRLTALEGVLLNGAVNGWLRAGWSDGFRVAGALQGRRLDPARLMPAWRGAVNIDITGGASWNGTRLTNAHLDGRLLESRLQERSLAGSGSLLLQGDVLTVRRASLTGRGFRFSADGRLDRQVAVMAQISDLAVLMPGTGGHLELTGRGRYADGALRGTVSGSGGQIILGDFRAGSFTLHGRYGDTPAGDGGLALEVSRGAYRTFRADTARLTVTGAPLSHRIEVALRSADSDLRGAASGWYRSGGWNGEVTTLAGTGPGGPWRLAAPAPLFVTRDHVSIRSFVLAGVNAERLALAADLRLQPLRGSGSISWDSIDLSRLDRFIPSVRLTGMTAGRLRFDELTSDGYSATGHARMTGSVTSGGRTIGIRSAAMDIAASSRGTRIGLDVRNSDGFTASGTMMSRDPAVFALPAHGELQARWQGVEAAVLQPWLPAAMTMHGTLSGNISGSVLPGRRLDLTGTAAVSGGGGEWRSGSTGYAASLRKADLTWKWRDRTLEGDIRLALQESGAARGVFRIPLEARIGARVNPDGPVTAALSGTLREQGMLSGLFPGLLQESMGDCSFDLQGGGSWNRPLISGTLSLQRAGAYLPAPGIRLRDVSLAARLEGGVIRVESFRAVSGSGSLNGSGTVRLDGLRLSGYRGVLRGENFQAVYLPELRLKVNPELTFEGTMEKCAVRGTITVPELLVNDPPSAAVVQPSSDVVVPGRKDAPAAMSGPEFDIVTTVTLGDSVVIRSRGLDARLEGGVRLAVGRDGAATGNGEIRVSRGSYVFYGIMLDIERGRALFKGPVQRPTLDILAVRTVESVKAGVAVTGTPENPVITLYSAPGMADVDVLSYIMLGRRMGTAEKGDQLALLAGAASMLVSAKDTPPLQEQFRQRLGLDTFSIASGQGNTAGYKPLEPSLGAAAGTKPAGSEFSRTMLLVGKYLTPDLYLSYGRSLFSQDQEVRARYSITKQWEVESKFSTGASGGDMYYRIEFR